jgi:ribosomal protein S18 acetylase RimI-like enzyme
MITAPITIATTTDAERAIAALVLAFSMDPVCRWTWPEPERYLASFPRFVRAFAGQAFEQGTAYCVEGYAGAALWHSPGIQAEEEPLVALFQETVAEEDQADLFAVIEQMAGYHPSEPHWYLPLIGVDPSQQRKGHGSTLMRQALAACDRDGTAAYLESTNPENISLYQRHGFEVLGRIQVGASPPIFPMLRPPR